MRSVSGDPWSLADAPLTLRVPARRVRGWKMRQLREVISEYSKMVRGNWKLLRRREHGHFLLTPPLPTPDSLANRLGKKTEWIDPRCRMGARICALRSFRR